MSASPRHIFFLGIGGIGMSALARYYHQKGVHVSGYDRYRSPICQELEKEGMLLFYEQNISPLPKAIDLIVYTPAISSDQPLFAYLANSGIPMVKRAAVLGDMSKSYNCLAVAGTHGKTTISSMLTHLLSSLGVRLLAFIGGISKNLQSNFLGMPEAEYMVVEADEYDRSFLQLHPSHALISATDADHLDVYGQQDELIKGFAAFAELLPAHGRLLRTAKTQIPGNKGLLYGMEDPQCDYYACNIRLRSGIYCFDLQCPEERIDGFELHMPGRHNVENAVGALALLHQLEFDMNELQTALKTYKGVHRRFDIQLCTDASVYIDDYAHHPEEIRACLEAVRELYPDRKLLCVFQPHLYTRTRDFAYEFAKALSIADRVILLPVYPAREKPLTGVSEQLILQFMEGQKVLLFNKDEVIEYVKKEKPELLVSLGAGDIDQMTAHFKNALTR